MTLVVAATEGFPAVNVMKPHFTTTTPLLIDFSGLSQGRTELWRLQRMPHFHKNRHFADRTLTRSAATSQAPTGRSVMVA
jgi:hypothetical protein